MKAAIKDLKPGQANWFFCSGKFKAAERVMDGENGHVMVKGQWKENHKTKCRAFMKEHKNEFEGVKYAHQVDW